MGAARHPTPSRRGGCLDASNAAGESASSLHTFYFPSCFPSCTHTNRCSHPHHQGSTAVKFDTLAMAMYHAGVLQQAVDAHKLIELLGRARGRRRFPEVAALWQGAACAFALQPESLAVLAAPLRAALEAVGSELSAATLGDARRLVRVHHAMALLCPGHHLLQDAELAQCMSTLERERVGPTTPAREYVVDVVKQLQKTGVLHSARLGPVSLLPASALRVDAVVQRKHGPPVAVVCDGAWQWLTDEGARRVPSGMAVLHRALAGALGYEYAVVDVASPVEQLRSAMGD